MSDTSPAIDPTLTPDETSEIEQVVKEVKRGFSLKDRLEKRGLRKVTVTLFLDENIGSEHKEIADQIAALDAQITELSDMRLKSAEGYDQDAALLNEIERISAEREALVPQRDELESRLREDALIVHLRAVPPVIARDAHRRARAELGIEEKSVPRAKMDDFLPVMNCHLLSLTVQSITDTATNETNDGLSYQDARDLMDYLPSSQTERLANALNEVQFRDAFSESIEAQEDFS